MRPALADQQYDVRGEDLYHIGSSTTVSRVVYAGQERLTVERDRGRIRYDAQARYTRDGDDGKRIVDARFVQELSSDGSFNDQIDNDPDFLTILNQPFAIQLDAATLGDLRDLRGRIPFDATSPLGGQAALKGFLRPKTSGKIDGREAVAVAFEADGPMTAPMPAKTDATMSGRMRMDGTAYYSVDDAMLVALDATLTIVAQLHDGGKTVPVRIVYRRTIRASGASSVTKPLPKTLRPVPLLTGGEAALRAAP